LPVLFKAKLVKPFKTLNLHKVNLGIMGNSRNHFKALGITASSSCSPFKVAMQFKVKIHQFQVIWDAWSKL
jgi:hypothetical protein